jgi:hypothetical protein
MHHFQRRANCFGKWHTHQRFLFSFVRSKLLFELHEAIFGSLYAELSGLNGFL